MLNHKPFFTLLVQKLLFFIFNRRKHIAGVKRMNPMC